MKLKLKSGPGDVTGVPILDTFIVETPFLTKREQEEVRKKSIPLQQRNNGIFAEEDPELAARAQADAYIRRWQGLTNDILRAIGCVIAEDVPVGPDGFIAYDAELAADIWREAYDTMFANKIKAHSHQIQIVAYEQKKTPRSSAAA
jgi:hypothetical protein